MLGFLRAKPSVRTAVASPACCLARPFATKKKVHRFNHRSEAVKIPQHLVGFEILHDPLYNKGTAFPPRERDRFAIRGLLPRSVFSLETQVHRTYLGLQRLTSPFESKIAREGLSEEMKQELENSQNYLSVLKYDYMAQLKDRNETLYYNVLVNYIEELAPIVYTPTIGVACTTAGQIFRRPRGLYISRKDKGSINAVVSNCPIEDVELTVMTDGSRILGLGDLGAHGMAIPHGKLSLYTAAGGLNPAKSLPIMIDVGTNNQKLVHDPLYLGLREPRMEGEEFYEFMDEVVDALVARWPNILLHFEDFRNPRAEDLLSRYRDNFNVFNDDIQGTGAMVLSALMSAVRVKGDLADDIKNQKIVCLGAGSAGMGVCDAIRKGMMMAGATLEEANSKFWVVDVNGLLGSETEGLTDLQQTFARTDDSGGANLTEVIAKVKPDILMGLTGVANTFTKEALEEVAKHHDQPMVFAMSNPTRISECTAEQAYEYTNGKCLFAGGSPFEPVVRDGKTVLCPSQANNMYIFPGIGHAVVALRSKHVSDKMLYEASKAVADCLSDEDIKDKKLFPAIKDIRQVSLKVAVAVAKQMIEEGLAQEKVPDEFESLEEFLEVKMWEPVYKNLVQDAYGH